MVGAWFQNTCALKNVRIQIFGYCLYKERDHFECMCPRFDCINIIETKTGNDGILSLSHSFSQETLYLFFKASYLNTGQVLRSKLQTLRAHRFGQLAN